jgi:F-type H+-transporting ATPase subunit alpha
LKRLERGKRITEILKQQQYSLYDEISEILSIFAVTSGLFDDININEVLVAEQQMIEFIKKTYPGAVKRISTGGKIDDASRAELEKEIKEFKKINNYGTTESATT